MKIAPQSVELIDYMGTDLTIVNSARVSFNKKSDWEYEFDELKGTLNDNPHLSERDEKLINYLAKHNHWTPFAHAFASFRIKAPIFVARQLVKHQVGLAWNEVSRRYVDDEPEFWFPKEWRERPDGSIKQGSGRVLGNEQPSCDLMMYSQTTTQNALHCYNEFIRIGVSPEQARMVLPQNTMTEWIWSGSLAAFARVCKLRMDSHAQQETQEVAMMIHNHLVPLFPVSFKALLEN